MTNPTPFFSLKNVLRFLQKIEETENCWNWKGGLFTNGYGMFDITHGKKILAHRFSYELFKGEIPQRLQLDHLCRNRRCVNPDHLEVVTQKENILRGFSFSAVNSRKTHCPRGHELSVDNLTRYSLRRGTRVCRICRNLNSIEWHKNHPESQKQWRKRNPDYKKQWRQRQ